MPAWFEERESERMSTRPLLRAFSCVNVNLPICDPRRAVRVCASSESAPKSQSMLPILSSLPLASTNLVIRTTCVPLLAG